MKHIFRGLAATLVLMATQVTAWAGISPEMAEKLMRKSGAWAQLADVPAQVRSGITQAPIRSQLPPADLARLERSADAAFSTDRLRSIALSVLVTELSAHHAVEAMAWYSSPTGLVITALEEAASHEFTNLNAALRDGNAALAAATPERQTLIIRLVRATQSADSSVNTMVHSMVGLAQGVTRHETRLVARANAETQTEVAWRQSMEDSALVGLRARDADGRILYVNKTMCDMVGYSRAELVGLMPPLPFWPPDAVDDMMARNLKTLAGGAPKTGFETRWHHRDGQLIDVMIFESRLVNAKGVHIGWMGSIIDISERKRLEDKDRQHGETLAQHARLNDMGLLASELSHELNQPLTTILSYGAGLSMSLKKLPGVDAEDLAAMNEIVRHAGKAGEIVNWIRRQASRSEPVRKHCDLNAVVADVLQLRKRHIQRANAKLVTDLSPVSASVVVDRIGIDQVVSNLVRNAADAVNGQPGGGIIGITTEVTEEPAWGNQRIQVTVRDNGPGLQGRTIDMLCTTFYSTKSDGMGLGLGICRTIVESHGGSLVAEEAHGGGAQFRFTLPLVATTAS